MSPTAGLEKSLIGICLVFLHRHPIVTCEVSLISVLISRHRFDVHPLIEAACVERLRRRDNLNRPQMHRLTVHATLSQLG
jgi:hypothetical protein